MSQATTERRKNERLNQKLLSDSNYVCIFDTKSKESFTYEITKDVWNEIKNDDDLKFFPTEMLSRFVAENFGSDSCFVTAVGLVIRHLTETDVELIKVIREQKHNTFCIVVDVDNYEKSKVDRPSFVFASSPKNNFNDANGFGITIGQMYLETSKM